MTLSQLRTFVLVARTGSVRQAAARLFVSQPAVSAALAAIQRELGVTLVTREGRGVRLTAAGVVFGRYARQVLGLLEEAAVATLGEVHPERGTVRLAAVTTAGEHVVPRFLASFRARYPEAQIVLEVGNRNRVWDLLDNHEVDLAVGGRPPTRARFVTLATRPNALVVVAAPDSRRGPLPGPFRPVTVAELEAQVWLVREPGSGTRSTVEELFEELRVVPVTLTVGSNGAIRESVQVGLGVSLISRDAVTRELDQGDLEEWRVPGLPRQRSWHLVGRSGEELPGAARLFLAHVGSPAGAGLGAAGEDRFDPVVAGAG